MVYWLLLLYALWVMPATIAQVRNIKRKWDLTMVSLALPVFWHFWMAIACTEK